jgi:hypothetical protein
VGRGHHLIRRCSEPGCKNRLVYPEGHEKAGQPKPSGTKTCSPACRQRRHERKKRERIDAGKQTKFHPEVQEMAAVTRNEMKDAAHEVVKEELRPLVRDAMTTEVLASIQTMVGLTPRAIEVLQEQMSSSDETIAQRAATLFLKYTMGNPSVAPPPAQQAPAPMSVVFNIPRPGDTTPPGSAHQPIEDVIEAAELRQCTDCSQHKPEQEFVGASSRCQECFDALHETLAQRFAVEDETAPDA